MADVYLAKSDLTGAVYAVHGKSKTNVTEFVAELIKIETDRVKSERDYVLDVLKNLVEAIEVERNDPSYEDRYISMQSEMAFTKAKELIK